MLFFIHLFAYLFAYLFFIYIYFLFIFIFCFVLFIFCFVYILFNATLESNLIIICRIEMYLLSIKARCWMTIIILHWTLQVGFRMCAALYYQISQRCYLNFSINCFSFLEKHSCFDSVISRLYHQEGCLLMIFGLVLPFGFNVGFKSNFCISLMKLYTMNLCFLLTCFQSWAREAFLSGSEMCLRICSFFSNSWP